MAAAGTGLTKTTMLLLSSRRVGRWMSTNLAEKNDSTRKKKRETDEKRDDPSFWMPHHRTRIYFPVGHDRVMEDVPDDAASFDQTHWLRSVDGVDKPDHDGAVDYYYKN
ncbi:hypothetical protein U1Q18_035144 [Sarracenia purpurea var. burkii]